MNGLVIGLYGVYLMLVGFAGNSTKLKDYAVADAPGYLPWAVSLGVLAALYQNDNTRKVAQPFLVLLILTFVLQNFDTIKKQSLEIWNMAQSNSTGVPK